jgi:hypothetical protein
VIVGVVAEGFLGQAEQTAGPGNGKGHGAKFAKDFVPFLFQGMASGVA